MHSSAKFLIAVLILAFVPVVQGQSSSPRALYTDALGKERVLRRQLDSSKSAGSREVMLDRVRTLVGSYQRMARRFPTSPYMDNALWQGALLSADAFWAFGEAADKAAALELFATLRSRFPSSSLVKQAPPHVKRLQAARPTPPRPRRAATPAAPAAPVAIATTTAVPLTAVRRDVLPEAVRVTIELAQEVVFRTDRIAGPARVFLDFDNTQAVEALKDATLQYTDDVVRQVRIGRQTDQRTRVVMDLAGAGRHSVYTLYNPYRVVIDVERPTGTAAPAAVLAREPAPAGPSLSSPAPAAASVPPVTVPTTALSPPADRLDLPEPGPLATADATPAAPTPPAVNRSGGFSLSRQLGLGVSRIVLDAGHGGHDPGAKVSGLTEADLVLDVTLRLEQLLLKHDGFEVVLTRRVDTFVPLEERTAIANREGADLFLSIHANASTNRAARGVETYFLNLTANPDAEMVAARENATSSRSMGQLNDIVKAIALNNKIDESRDFASMIQSSMITQIQKADKDVRNLGVKQAPFMVLLGATMPSVLAEISFITNREDAAMLKTEKHRQRIAEALYAGIVRYQQSLKKVPAIAEQ